MPSDRLEQEVRTAALRHQRHTFAAKIGDATDARAVANDQVRDLREEVCQRAPARFGRRAGLHQRQLGRVRLEPIKILHRTFGLEHLEPDVFVVPFDQGFQRLREGVVIAIFRTGRHLQNKHPRSGLQGLNRKHDGGQNSDEHNRNGNSRGHNSG
jgi:hypothetical protein